MEIRESKYLKEYYPVVGKTISLIKEYDWMVHRTKEEMLLKTPGMVVIMDWLEDTFDDGEYHILYANYILLKTKESAIAFKMMWG